MMPVIVNYSKSIVRYAQYTVHYHYSMGFTLSLAMIVKNEALAIERVLASARPVCDEMIVVDTGSTDQTVELAERMGAKITHFPWIDDFSAARNYSIEQCTCDWILFLDADDILPEATQRKILAMKSEGVASDIDVFEMLYHYKYDVAGRCTESYYTARLARRRPWHRFENPVHEYLFYYKSRARRLEDVFVEHHQDDSIQPERYDRVKRILAAALARGDESPQTLFYHAFHLFRDEQWHEASSYFKKYVEKLGLAGLAYDALIRLAQCAIHLGDWNAALARAREAVEADPNRAEAFVLMGRYHVMRKEWDAAIPFFERAASLVRPPTVFAIDGDYTWVPWDFLSLCYAETGNLERAAESGVRALEFGIDTERIKGNLAVIQQRIPFWQNGH